ncbi:unnamed protein product [Arabidopsis halleri]
MEQLFPTLSLNLLSSHLSFVCECEALFRLSLVESVRSVTTRIVSHVVLVHAIWTR